MKEALVAAGVEGMTLSEVKGFGRIPKLNALFNALIEREREWRDSARAKAKADIAAAQKSLKDLEAAKAAGRSQPDAVPSPWQEFFEIVASLPQAVSGKTLRGGMVFHHSLNSPLCSCVSITLPAFIGWLAR